MRKQKQYHFIYKTTNLLSGRYYIGMHSTDNLEDGYLGSGTNLKRSLNKHGKNIHVLEILEFCKSREELKSREKEIVNLNEIAKKECMNLIVGGVGTGRLGTTMSESSRKKISMSNSNPSEETRKKMSKSQTGKILSDETKQKMSKSKMGHVGYTKGMKFSKETRDKLSEMRRGKKQKIIKCPHCGKYGGNATMPRWHFDNCKLKGNIDGDAQGNN
jgi:group I intron endonuclease